MNARALCIGPYIAATDFGTPGIINAKEPTFTIGSAVHEQVPDLKTGKEKTRGIIYFTDYPRGWLINKTNMQLLAGLHGDETDGWIGKRVTLHAVRTNMGPGIEVKGSPDIERPKDVVVKLPKKSPRTVTLVPTGARRASAPAANADDLAAFQRELQRAVKEGGWTRDQIADLLASHGTAKAADLAPEKRAAVVAIVRQAPVGSGADGDDEPPPPPEE
jgi:hypothetical protein